MNNRREFIKKASAGIGAFSIIPAHVLFKKNEIKAADGKLIRKASYVPSDKINLACCGIGNRGGKVLNGLFDTGLVNIVALCDVDMGAAHTKDNMKKFPKAKRFQDFRELFDKQINNFDAVSIGTPDHSHFPISMLAMSEGKHIYVEKPLARTFNEIELLMNAEKKYNVAAQMGNQGHSSANFFQFKAWVEAGVIKDVTKIVAHMNGERRWHGWDTSMTSFPKGMPVPETMDWDTWLMTAQHHDYHKDLVNGQWRCWYDFGMGALGDWGAHIIDTAHRFLQLGLPNEVEPVKIEGHNALFFPQASTINFKFPARKNMPPVDLIWYDGVNNIPEVPEGYGKLELDPNIPPPGNGNIQPSSLGPGKIIYSKDLIFKGGSHGSTLSIIPESKHMEMQDHLPDVPTSPSDHFVNFLRSCKGEETCRSALNISGPLSQVFTLGTIAQRLKTTLVFDRQKKVITNNTLANYLLIDAPPRKGWEQFYKL